MDLSFLFVGLILGFTIGILVAGTRQPVAPARDIEAEEIDAADYWKRGEEPPEWGG